MQFEKKDKLYSLTTSEVIDSESCGCFNTQNLLFQNTLRESTCSWVLNTADTIMATPLTELSIDAKQIELKNISVGEI